MPQESATGRCSVPDEDTNMSFYCFIFLVVPEVAERCPKRHLQRHDGLEQGALQRRD